MRCDPLKMHVISTLCSDHNAKISRHIGLLQNVITRWILKITQQYFGFIHYYLYSSMSNCFRGHRLIFIFDLKCKLSDTPDCDWHASGVKIQVNNDWILYFNGDFLYHGVKRKLYCYCGRNCSCCPPWNIWLLSRNLVITQFSNWDCPMANNVILH